MSIAFSEPTGLSAVALHLPAGLTAQARAIPFCSRKSLLADFCPRSSKVGTIDAVAVAYGLELPVTARPGDGGIDMAIAGLPSDVSGIPVRLEKIGFSIKGTARTRTKKRFRMRAFLTNPRSCSAATSMVDITLSDAAVTTLTASSSFTPLSCAGSRP
jgi:hypothetical protein